MEDYRMKDVKELIPHREPFLFVDKIISTEGNKIVAEKYISEEEFYFKGHYPGNPIMPGVLICESMFQTGALLMAQSLTDAEGSPVVTRVNNIRFKNMVKPGDTINIEVVHTETISTAYCFKGKVRIAGKPGVTGKLSASCEFICTLVKEG